MRQRDWIPVAPSWERNPDDNEIWRKAAVLPSLAFNQAEIDMLGPVTGLSVCILGIGDGLAALALAGMGARVTAIDPSQSLLDMLMVRARIIGAEMDYIQADLPEFVQTRLGLGRIAYAAQTAARQKDLGRFYAAAYAILAPGGRLIVNEYHPFRRIWKQEPGQLQQRYSYFQRSRERTEDDAPDPTSPGSEFSHVDYQWTIADHFYHLTEAGFRVAAVEEVGEVRQHWEMPNLKGIPEQLILAADRPE